MTSKTDKFYTMIMRVLMFISSYFPLYVMVIILHFSEIEKGWIDANILVIVFTIVIAILILLSVLTLIILKIGNGTKEKVIRNLESSEDLVLSYIMTYIIPLTTNGANSIETYLGNIFLFLLIGYIYLKLNLIYLNPLWTMFGYIIYRDANKEFIITNISRETLKYAVKLKGYYISNTIFIAHKKDNSSM